MPDDAQTKPIRTSNEDTVTDTGSGAQLPASASNPSSASGAENQPRPARSTDLVRVAEDVFAVRWCQHCAGSGQYHALRSALSERIDVERAGWRALSWCRCVRSEADVIRLHLAEISNPSNTPA